MNYCENKVFLDFLSKYKDNLKNFDVSDLSDSEMSSLIELFSINPKSKSRQVTLVNNGAIPMGSIVEVGSIIYGVNDEGVTVEAFMSDAFSDEEFREAYETAELINLELVFLLYHFWGAQSGEFTLGI